MIVLNKKAVDRAMRLYNSAYDIYAYIHVATMQAMGDGKIDDDFAYENGGIRILFDCVKPTVYSYDEVFEDVEGLETDLEWGDIYLTDREYEHLFDDVKIIKQK